LPLDSRYFPSITAYPNDDGIIDFKYVGYLENGLDCVTLRARTCAEPARDIVVKFVDRYGEWAHRLLADVGLAPKLWYYGSPRLTEEQPSYRFLFMVVMEYIEGRTLATLKEKMGHKTTGVQSEINRALSLLHSHGLVFGDLRSPNIMVKKTGEVKLVDFNWAGVQGQVKYPYLISKDIHWPEGVEALAIIEYDHDLEMFRRLFS
jgi:serine/threonine protein kinase